VRTQSVDPARIDARYIFAHKKLKPTFRLRTEHPMPGIEAHWVTAQFQLPEKFACKRSRGPGESRAYRSERANCKPATATEGSCIFHDGGK
jgi:hypothetical protein